MCGRASTGAFTATRMSLWHPTLVVQQIPQVSVSCITPAGVLGQGPANVSLAEGAMPGLSNGKQFFAYAGAYRTHL